MSLLKPLNPNMLAVHSHIPFAFKNLKVMHALCVNPVLALSLAPNPLFKICSNQYF